MGHAVLAIIGTIQVRPAEFATGIREFLSLSNSFLGIEKIYDYPADL